MTTKIELEWVVLHSCNVWNQLPSLTRIWGSWGFGKISLIKTISVLFQNFSNVHLKWGLLSHWASSGRVLKCFNHFLLVKILLRCSPKLCRQSLSTEMDSSGPTYNSLHCNDDNFCTIFCFSSSTFSHSVQGITSSEGGSCSQIGPLYISAGTFLRLWAFMQE